MAKQHNNVVLYLCCFVIFIFYSRGVEAYEEIIEIYDKLPFLFNDSLSIHHKRATNLNTDYLGAGYNILKGNPISLDPVLLRDAGWITNRILNLPYSDQLTTDGLYYIPVGASIQKINSCQYYSTSSQSIGIKSYSSNLATYASASGGSFSGSFSLSVGFTQALASTTYNKNVLVHTVASCAAYTASLYPFNTYTYTPVSAFVNALNLLPNSYDPNNPTPFKDFFNNWGTHVSQQIYMGGRATSTYQFSESSYNDLQSYSINVEAAARASWGVYSGDATTKNSYSQTETSYFDSKVSSVVRQYLGSPPPVNPPDTAAWAAAITVNPFALSYVLVKIDSLVSSFPGYATKGSAIAAALADICAKTPGCMASLPDDPIHTPSHGKCRICANCGGDYPLEVGKRLNAGDWGAWAAYDGQCGGVYTSRWDEVKLCCSQTSTTGANGLCKYCASCGGYWPVYQGSRINAGDFGAFQMLGGSCSGGYDARWDPPQLCCAVPDRCKLCDYCGTGWTEAGRGVHWGDWGPWNTYQGCGDYLYGSWNEPVLCCKT